MWKRVRTILGRLRRDHSGATVIEYAMIVVLVGLVLLTLQYSIGASVSNFFMEAGNGL